MIFREDPMKLKTFLSNLFFERKSDAGKLLLSSQTSVRRVKYFMKISKSEIGASCIFINFRSLNRVKYYGRNVILFIREFTRSIIYRGCAINTRGKFYTKNYYTIIA